jgi:hypothetical protein
VAIPALAIALSSELFVVDLQHYLSERARKKQRHLVVKMTIFPVSPLSD